MTILEARLRTMEPRELEQLRAKLDRLSARQLERLSTRAGSAFEVTDRFLTERGYP